MSVKLISRDTVDRDANGKLYIVDDSRPTYYSNYHRHPRYKCRAKETKPRFDRVEEGSAVALDIEGVLLADEISIGKSGVGRVSITNERGEVVYDVFAYYPESVNNRPSPQKLNLGVKYKDILPRNGARPISEVLANAEKIFEIAGTVVCHAIENEIHYMSARTLKTTDGDEIDTYGFDLTKYTTYDTQTFGEYREYGAGYQRKPKLATLARAVLGRAIQVSEHSSVEDAQATMDLFLRRREDFEAGGAAYWSSSTTVVADALDTIGAWNEGSDVASEIAEEAGDSSVAVLASCNVNPDVGVEDMLSEHEIEVEDEDKDGLDEQTILTRAQIDVAEEVVTETLVFDTQITAIEKEDAEDTADADGWATVSKKKKIRATPFGSTKVQQNRNQKSSLRKNDTNWGGKTLIIGSQRKSRR